MKQIFLFNGGLYKFNQDDGRVRKPLTPTEAQLIFYDTEIPGDTDNSIGSTLNMGVYANELKGLEVDDEIYVGLVPDAVVLRGLWFASNNSVEGFKGKVDLVSVPEVYNNLGESVATFEGTSALDVDFTNGIGHATIDAESEAKFWGGEASEYRNLDALQATFFDQTLAGLGQSTYLRLTVTDLGKFGENADEGCCSSCGESKYPTFQVGAVYDRLCVQKQLITNFCNCGDNAIDEIGYVDPNADA